MKKFDWSKPCEQFWQAPGKFVCSDCVEDDFLKDTIEKHLAGRKCDYCGRSSKGKMAAPLAAIMVPIATALCHYFTPAEEAGLPEECNHDDLITTLDALKTLLLSCSKELLTDVANAFGHENWDEGKKGNPYDLENSILYSWSRFACLVKHRQRFFFSTHESGYQFPWVLPPQEMLGKIKEIVDNNDYGLVKPWPGEDEEGVLYRARKWEDDPASQISSLRKKKEIKWPPEAKDFGPPPEKKAGAQRMSPAGISYTYTAMERETALAEVVRRPPCQLAVARFAFEREALSLLDLTKLPKVSVFDQAKRHDYMVLSFLHAFSELISLPVELDKREHYEYVPTQIVSEYFAHVYRTPKDKPIDGMIYGSAVRPGGRNVVLFPPRRDRKCSINRANLDIEQKPVEVRDWINFFRELNEAT